MRTRGEFGAFSWPGGIPTNRVELVPCPDGDGIHQAAKQSYLHFVYPDGKTAEDGVDPTGINLRIPSRCRGVMIVFQ